MTGTWFPARLPVRLSTDLTAPPKTAPGVISDRPRKRNPADHIAPLRAASRLGAPRRTGRVATATFGDLPKR
jgi:hypothetical protein